jgi:hypothetical protein
VIEKGKKKRDVIKVSGGQVPAGEYDVVGTVFNDKKSAKDDPKCEIQDQYVCVIEKGKKKRDVIKVSGGQVPAGEYDVVGTVFNDKKSAKDDPKCDPIEVEPSFYYCVPGTEGEIKQILGKNEKKARKEAGLDKKTKLYESKELAFDNWKIDCPVSDVFNCYFCDPEKYIAKEGINAIVSVSSKEFIGDGKNNISSKKWSDLKDDDDVVKYRFTKKIVGEKFDIMYKAIKKKNPTLLNRFKDVITNDRAKFVACEFGDRRGDSVKGIALRYGIDSGVCSEKEAQDCLYKYGIKSGVVDLGEFKSIKDAQDALNKARDTAFSSHKGQNPSAAKVPGDIKQEGNVLSLITDEVENMVSCGWTATVKTFCGEAKLTEQAKQDKKLTCEAYKAIPGTSWDDENCYCKVGSINFKTIFDTCEFEFNQKSFDDILDVSVSGKTEESVIKKDWPEVESKVKTLIEIVKMNAELKHTCTLDIQGLASYNGLRKNCVSYINKAARTNHTEKDLDKNQAIPVNETLGLLRAQKLHEYIKSSAGKYMDGKCTADHCGAVSKKPTKVSSSSAIVDQMFQVQYSCDIDLK